MSRRCDQPPRAAQACARRDRRSRLGPFVIVSKFADHLPLYRLEDILTRHGVFLSRSTLCDWVRNAGLVLQPLAELQKSLVLQSPILWTDDTPVTGARGKGTW